MPYHAVPYKNIPSDADAWSKHGNTDLYAEENRVCFRTYNLLNKLHSPWFGPYRVREALGDRNYRLRDLSNNILDDKFHTSQLRPYRTYVDEQPFATDEFLVDRVLQRRSHDGRTEYKVK